MNSKTHPPYSLRNFLRKELEGPGTTKGERTRIKLLLATLDTLDDTTYQEMRITDICKEAGVSHGLFYHHFPDKKAITEAVASEFMDLVLVRIGESKEFSDRYDKLFISNHHYIEMYRRNTGVLRVLNSNTEDLPEMKAKLSRICFEWHLKIATSLEGTIGSRKLNADDQLLIGYSLGGMADEILRQIFILKTPYLKSYRPLKAAGDLTEMLSILWYRAIFGTDPSKAAIKKARTLI